LVYLVRPARRSEAKEGIVTQRSFLDVTATSLRKSFGRHGSHPKVFFGMLPQPALAKASAGMVVTQRSLSLKF